MLKIRLRRVGKTKKPYYRLVLAESRDKRDGDFIETLGSYDPHADPPSARIDEARVREWIAKGAQPSESAAKIIKRAGLLSAEAAAKDA